MESLGTGPTSALDSTFGALFVGLILSAFFQGLLTVQTYNYYEDFRGDPVKIKLTVALVWLLDAVHLVLVGQSAYHYLITNWGYQPALALSTREICVQLIFIGLSTFVCQIFFLSRIWIFSNKNIPVVGSILAMCITTLVVGLFITAKILQVPFLSEFGTAKAQIIVLFVLGAAADILIAGLLCYYLQHDHQSGLESTKSLIAKILRYTIATGSATSALGIASIIAYFAQPEAFYYIAIHFCLGRLYTNALLITLNARHKFRKSLHRRTQTSDGVDGRGTGLQFARFISPVQSADRTVVSIDRVVVTDRDNGNDDQVQRKLTSSFRSEDHTVSSIDVVEA